MVELVDARDSKALVAFAEVSGNVVRIAELRRRVIVWPVGLGIALGITSRPSGECGPLALVACADNGGHFSRCQGLACVGFAPLLRLSNERLLCMGPRPISVFLFRANKNY